ncbi:hypothetical protein DFH11DRAFT_1878812 [Phellopilus nigrolimitatus]|nr:hypothetical protein DFH11DRAFT_1878812 [Phellopilus nigrolimitatus]
MNITVDYEGPSLSDTSLDEYRNCNSSGSSMTLSFGSAACTKPEDDIVTVSSRDTGLLVQKRKTAMNGGSGSTVQEFHFLSGLSPSLTQARSMRYPADPSAVFEQLKLSESSKPIERNTQWLRDQMSRAINGIVTPESVVSDGSSLALSGDDLDAQSPFDGDLALQQDNGRYYYTYTSGNLSFAASASASASAAHDDKTLAQSQSKSGSSDYPYPSSSNRQSASSSTSDPLPRTADTPAEVRKLVPPACTDCSVCGVLLDAFRYVCSTCGRRTLHPRASAGANGHANGYADGKGKARADVVDVSMFDSLVYHRAHTRTASRSPRARARCPCSPPHPPLICAIVVDGRGRRRVRAVPGLLRDGACMRWRVRHAEPRQKGYFRHAYLETCIVQKLRTLLRVLQYTKYILHTLSSMFPTGGTVLEAYSVQAAGSRLNSSHPKACHATLYHNVALCDHCMDRIKGEWSRCVY